jgi:hypothetical protein
MSKVAKICKKLATNWLQSILDFGFQKFLGCNGKKSLLKKKKAENPNFKITSRSKKHFSGKKFFHEVLISIRRINVQKISQIGDGHWSLGRFL